MYLLPIGSVIKIIHKGKTNQTLVKPTARASIDTRFNEQIPPYVDGKPVIFVDEYLPLYK